MRAGAGRASRGRARAPAPELLRGRAAEQGGRTLPQGRAPRGARAALHQHPNPGHELHDRRRQRQGVCVCPSVYKFHVNVSCR